MKLLFVLANDQRLVECNKRYFEEISVRFGVSFDPEAGEPATRSNISNWHVLATISNQPVACGSLRDLGNFIGEIKRVWVDSGVRGRGVGKAVMDLLEEKARREKFHYLRLDTNRTLEEARQMYLRRGYQEISRYNDNPYADYFFQKKLVPDPDAP